MTANFVALNQNELFAVNAGAGLWDAIVTGVALAGTAGYLSGGNPYVIAGAFIIGGVIGYYDL
jgi:hypothetical protein